MRVTNWCRKLMAGLVAGGLMAPIGLQAADLDTNLINNSGFETVDIASSLGGYNAVEILNWTDGTGMGFAYSHDGSLNSGGMTIPDYANGGTYTGGTAPAGTGSFYFTSNATPGDITTPGQFSQNVDLSAGATGTLIPMGEAAAQLNGFFSSFSTNGDFGTLHVEFLDGSSSSLGTIQVSDSDVTDWTQESIAGLVPKAAASARVSVFGTPLAGGPDGYIDNVDLRITNAANLLMFLEVDTASGNVAIKNETGDTINIDYYEIESPGDSLSEGAWNSLQNQPGFPGGDGSGNGWEEAGGSDNGILGESYLTGDSSVADLASISLGAAFNTGVGSEDLLFRYGLPSGSLVNGFVRYVMSPFVVGDMNGDGQVNFGDLSPFALGLTDISAYNAAFPDLVDTRVQRGDINTDDFFNFGDLTPFVDLLTGGGTASGSAVPEPSTVVLVGIGTLGLFTRGRWRKEDRA